MNIIVTAGGTSENIDSVRTITNMATGRLGVFVSELLLDTFENVKVYFLGSDQSISFFKERINIFNEYGYFDESEVIFIPITDTKSLEYEMTKLITEKEIKSVIHSMAVSDYSVEKVFDIGRIVNSIRENDFSKEEIIELLTNPPLIDNSSKISSKSEKLEIRLKKTPKIINMIKEVSPSTQLIGFKLLNNVSHEELISVARESIHKTGADYIVANDIKDGTGYLDHTGYIVDLGSEEKFVGKIEIAKAIVNLVKEVDFE